MKIVRLKENVVVEIIPDYALPVEKWYGAEFAKTCIEAPNDVEQHWTYENGVFSPPPEQELEPPSPTTEERVSGLEVHVDEISAAIEKGLSL